MSLRLDQLLKACTVRIEVPDKRSQGTGFFFAPGLILTCAHVVRKSVGELVEVFPSGHPQPIQAMVKGTFPDQVDLVILQIDMRSEHSFPCVLLGAEIQPRDSCYAYGYTDSKQGFPEGDPVTLECEGMTGGTIPNIKLKGGQVRPGLSGSPLLNLDTGKVCGVIKFTRAEGFDLGGGAIPVDVVFSQFPVLEKLHIDYHKLNKQWSELLTFDTDAFESDWTYLDEEAKKCENYIKTLFFLLKTAFIWFILGYKAPRAFPRKTIELLVRHAFKGDLGQEIKRQREELTRKIIFEVDLEGSHQARLLNSLDSHAQVLTQLINMLLSEEQDLASTSRLLWVTEALYEQRDLIEELKKREGNSYPQLESFKRRFKAFSRIEDRKYVSVDRIAGRLVARHTNTNFVLWITLKPILINFSKGFQRNPKLSILYIQKFLDWLTLNFTKLSVPTEFSTENLLSDLEEEIRRNPKLQVLRKFQVIVDSVAGVVRGGKFRAWNETGAYHFSRLCKLYPERVKPEEMNKILCYDTREEAERKHKPCKICLNAEYPRVGTDFLGDEPTE